MPIRNFLSYVVNEVIVESLASNKTFQRFVVRTNELFRKPVDRLNEGETPLQQGDLQDLADNCSQLHEDLTANSKGFWADFKENYKRESILMNKQQNEKTPPSEQL